MPFHTKKSLGQNFLINKGVLDKIVVAARLTKKDVVVEVGPGTGNLTHKLAATTRRLIAVEKDHRFINSLKEQFGESSNVEVIEDDILKFDPKKYHLTAQNYKIVANIPYYITSHFLRTIFESWPQPSLIVLTIQKEVAQRLMAKPPHMNLLALSVQYYADPEIIMTVSRGSFRPIPKVDSAIVRLIPRIANDKLQVTNNLFLLIRSGFGEKRKQLASVLAKKLKLPKETIVVIFTSLDLPATIRAENLSLEQWGRLSDALNA